MNADGVIAGGFWDPNQVSQRFVCSSSGTITTFEAPNAGSPKTQGSFPAATDVVATIGGWLVNQAGLNNGFLHAWDGSTTHFDDSIDGVFNDINLALHGFL